MIVQSTAMFEIHYDHHKKRITSMRSGFFDLNEVDRFRQTMLQTLGEARRSGGAFDILIDNSAGQALASDVAKCFEEVTTDIRSSGARRIALISPGALNRIQAKRITKPGVDDNLRVFEDAIAAEAWLAQA